MNNRISTSKKILFYLIMIGLTIAVCFTALEYGLARYYYSTQDQISNTVFDPISGWRLRPGTYWIKPQHTFRKHEVYINEFGLRNRDITTTAKPGVKRIIVLGDSFTAAMQIRNEYTFPVLLENLLNRTGHYEVINAGVPGYGTAQEMLFMKELAGKNIVGNVYLLVIFINDVLDNARLSDDGNYNSLVETPAQPGFVLDQNGELKLKYYPQKEYSSNLVAPQRTSAKLITPEVIRNRVKTFLQTRPDLVNFLNRLGFRAELSRMPGLINGWYREEVLQSGITLSKALMKEIREEATRNHAILIATLVPSPLQVYPNVYGPILRKTFADNKSVQSYFADVTRPQRITAETCNELGIPFLDLYPILIRRNDKELYIPADGHFSEDGHAIVAENLAAFINKYTSGNGLQP